MENESKMQSKINTAQLELFNESALPEAVTLHADRPGFFSLLIKPSGLTPRQSSYRVDVLPQVLAALDPDIDSYMSQATFFRPNRRLVNLWHLPLCFVDLDTYGTKYSAKDPEGLSLAVRQRMTDEGIPPPSLVVHSGRGLYLKWLLKSPLPQAALPRWNAVQRELVSRLVDFGADPKARDASRVLRLVATCNTKQPDPELRKVRVLWVEEAGGEPLLHDFERLAEAVLPFTRKETEAVEANKPSGRIIQFKSVVAWIGAEMEFALSQAVASGDTFERRPSECGHCVQDFLADLDLRDLPGEAAGFELGADDTLPTADLRFYPAALVVPCGHLPGHAAVAADLGNMAIPNGWIPRRLRSDHCVLWRRYNHIQGLPIPFPQQIPCRRSIIGAVRQKARDRGIQLIQKPGQGGAVSSVIVSQIGANNCTAGQVQPEVEFAPAAAYSLDFMLLREPFSFSEDLEAGTVHHQMDRHRSGLPHRLSDAQAVCTTRQCGEVRHPYIQPHERADGSHKSLRLPQRKPIRRAQRQACLDRQIRVSPLATP